MFFKKGKMITNKIRKKLLTFPNVNGVFFGEMTKEGEKRGQGLVVTVSKKVPKEELHAKAIVPEKIEGFSVDVIEVGDIKLLDVDRTAEYRPFPMGVSVGHYKVTAGTAGAIVRKNGDINQYLLSNNHVLANVNTGKIGDPIYQPGAYDGGTADHTIGTLAKYIPIKFASCSMSRLVTKLMNGLAKLFGSSSTFTYKNTKVKASQVNLVDCAIAKLLPGKAKPELIELGALTAGVGTTGVGDTVWKSGRTTQVQSGPVLTTNYTIQVDMGDGKMATFTDQILINKEGFSSGGDSGSAIVMKTQYDGLKLVGLLFAGSDKVTIANKISNVFNALDISL